MAELAMLADIQRTVYPEQVTHQLHVIAQTRESSPVIDQRSNHCATPPTILNYIHNMAAATVNREYLANIDIIVSLSVVVYGKFCIEFFLLTISYNCTRNKTKKQMLTNGKDANNL